MCNVPPRSYRITWRGIYTYPKRLIYISHMAVAGRKASLAGCRMGLGALGAGVDARVLPALLRSTRVRTALPAVTAQNPPTRVRTVHTGSHPTLACVRPTAHLPTTPLAHLKAARDSEQSGRCVPLSLR